MKPWKWKRLFYSLLILGLLGACGNNNKSGSSTILDSGNNGLSTDTVPTGLNSVDAFINAISAGSFRSAQRTDSKFDYIVYGSGTTSSFTYYCNIPGICNKNNLGNNFSVITRTVVNGVSVERSTNDQDSLPTDLVALKNELVVRLTAAKNASNSLSYQYQRYSDTAIIYKHNGYCYLVDLNQPLAANPVAKRKFTNGGCYGDGYGIYGEY